MPEPDKSIQRARLQSCSPEQDAFVSTATRGQIIIARVERCTVRRNLSTSLVVVASTSRPPISLGGAFPESVKRSTVAIKVLTSWGRARFRHVTKPIRWPFDASPLTSTVSAVVDFCIARPLWILGWAIDLEASSGVYVCKLFSNNT